MSTLPPADQALLASVRPPHERAVAEHIWLRTCYRDRNGNNTDAAHEALLKGSWIEETMHDLSQGTSVLDDATLYDHGWQRIFNRIPELINNPYDPDSYDQRKAEAIAEALEDDANQDTELGEQGDTESYDGTRWLDRYGHVQYLSALGVMWVADEEALCAEPPKRRKLLMVWFDECGRVVRWNRIRPRRIYDIIGLMYQRIEHEDVAWDGAEVGGDYYWDGVCGPPYASREEGTSP